MTVALVTGGGTGIGAAIAHRLATAGTDVVITGRRPQQLQQVAATHERIHAMAADASDSTAVTDLIDQVRHRFGRLDAVVANAGGHGYDTVGDTSDQAWADSLKANLTTAFVTIRESLPLLQPGSAIVIVSSLAGIRAAPQTAGYTVGKHALVGLMRSLARDYGRRGIRVNAVLPGWVRTPMADAEMQVLVDGGGASDVDDAYTTVTKDVPLRRPAEPDEIAGVVEFLLGPNASYVHGVSLVVDGGSHIVDVPTLAFG